MCGGQTGRDFGCPKCADSILGRKHGWIECKSSSFPGKVYYFHTVTRCSTWQRPVPRNTQLPRYKKLRDSRSLESLTDDQSLPSSFGVSGCGESVFTSDVIPPSDFELHARRMQIYLEKNTNYNLQALEYGQGEVLRDKLLKYYKSAKSELAKKLKEKKAEKKTVKVPIAKPKMRPNPNPNPNPVKKTIRECNGIKTISYDPIPRELPIDVKMPDLSETSIDSFPPNRSIGGQKKFDEDVLHGLGNEGIAAGHNPNIGRLVFKDLNLSESESGVDFVQS